jgi:hypothetical protein
MRPAESSEKMNTVWQDVVNPCLVIRDMLHFHSAISILGPDRLRFLPAFIAFPSLFEIGIEILTDKTYVFFDVVDKLGVLMEIKVSD